MIGAGSFVSVEPSRPGKLRSTALCGKQRRLRLHQDLCPETNQSLERLARAGCRALFLGMAFTHSPFNLLIPMKSRWNVCSRDRPSGRGSHQQECPLGVSRLPFAKFHSKLDNEKPSHIAIPPKSTVESPRLCVGGRSVHPPPSAASLLHAYRTLLARSQ